MTEEVTYVNKEYLQEKSKGEITFKELMARNKGKIATALTFFATNKAAVFLGGIEQDGFMYWLGQQSIKYPALSGLIKTSAGVVSVAWNALVANPNLCALVITALISFGAVVKWGIHKMKLKHQQKKGVVLKTNEKTREL